MLERPTVTYRDFLSEHARVEIAKHEHVERLIAAGVPYDKAVTIVHGVREANQRGWL